LLGLETRVAGGGVAFLEKTADKVAELGEGAVFLGGDLVAHEYILSYDDTFEKMGRLIGEPAASELIALIPPLHAAKKTRHSGRDGSQEPI
jgi:hypothetical protein